MLTINLTIGKEYTVYGMVFRDNSPWYYLCSEDYDEYPTPFPSECFDITDKRLSSYWNLLTREIGNGKIQSSLVIPEWAEDPYFYELLLDGDIDTVELFNRYKKLLDQE